MALTKEELGHRLRIARENAGLTQEEVAETLGVSRGLIGQIETGVKTPNSLQLARLADLYGRDVGDFLRVEFDESRQDALAALFRADTQLAEDHVRAQAVRDCAALCREYTNLETLLGIDKDRVYPVEYGAPPPRNRWEAIRQGERLAELERGRLKLGEGPIRDLADVLEPQGLRLVEIPLSENISGIFLHDPRYGLSIIVNADHHPRRKVFSYAHEYCHVLVDRDRTGMVSRAENREELSEVRANAFAAAFLMPEGGVRAFVRALGKGEPSRSVLQAFDDAVAVEGQKRIEAGSQDLQVYDVVHLAHHFGVSYEMALYRLLNLKLLSEEEQQRLAEQREMANTIRRYLGPDPQEKTPERREFRHQLLVLALEAFRREAISRGKLKELCALAQIPASEIGELVATLEGEARPVHKARAAYIPKEPTEDLVKELQEGVQDRADEKDFETHYKLGIAYKEMGLYDEAIQEFRLAGRDSKQALTCADLVGLCLLAKGQPDQAIRELRAALAVGGHPREGYHSLQYNLGVAYETQGDLERALELFEALQAEDAGFRDVRIRVQDLRERLLRLPPPSVQPAPAQPPPAQTEKPPRHAKDKR